MDMLPDADMAHNLVALLQQVVEPGQDADVAINPELRRVLVFVGDELVLSCSFDDLVSGPGVSLN